MSTRPIIYRQWTIHMRQEDDRWLGVLQSPYDELTAALQAEEKERLWKALKKQVDETIDEHYPKTELGRYLPPTEFHPRPGQPKGAGWVAGRQRLPKRLARRVCEAVSAKS